MPHGNLKKLTRIFSAPRRQHSKLYNTTYNFYLPKPIICHIYNLIDPDIILVNPHCLINSERLNVYNYNTFNSINKTIYMQAQRLQYKTSHTHINRWFFMRCDCGHHRPYVRIHHNRHRLRSSSQAMYKLHRLSHSILTEQNPLTSLSTYDIYTLLSHITLENSNNNKRDNIQSIGLRVYLSIYARLFVYLSHAIRFNIWVWPSQSH